MTTTNTTHDHGIDYGLGTTNVDHDSGIRYGVIHQNEVGSRWYEDSEPDYGDPTCGHCGNELTAIDDERVPDLDEEDENTSEWTDEGRDFACLTCKRSFDSQDSYADEPRGHNYKDEEYTATQDGDDCDIFVIKSPYYTRAQYCSPCAPGAVYLTNPVEDGPRGYCFGHEWFENGIAPYPVYRVSDDSEVKPERGKIHCAKCGISIPDMPEDATPDELLCDTCYREVSPE